MFDGKRKMTEDEVMDMYLKDFGRDYKKEHFTCFACSEKDECEYSFDPYNLDGYCFAHKGLVPRTLENKNSTEGMQ